MVAALHQHELIADCSSPAHRRDRFGIGRHHPVAAAAHQQHPTTLLVGESPGEQQRHRRTHGPHRHNPRIGEAGVADAAQPAALQGPAEVAIRIVQVRTALEQRFLARLEPRQLECGGGPPGVAQHHHPPGIHLLVQAEAAIPDGIEHGDQILRTAGQLLRVRRRRGSRQNGPLLAAVTAGMAGQRHAVTPRGQQDPPALEGGGAIPEAMGDQHEPAVG